MKTLVVAGALANRPYNAGGAWVRLSWLLGLKKLGFEVYFIEQIDPRACVDSAGAAAGFKECVNRDYFRQVVEQFGLADRAALIYGDCDEVHGAALADVLAVCKSAAALVNISGHLALRPLMDAFRRKVYIDIDPGFTQFWHAQGSAARGWRAIPISLPSARTSAGQHAAFPLEAFSGVPSGSRLCWNIGP